MDENNNFLDKNTLLAIGLSILFFIGWQFYVQTKYPEASRKQAIKKEKNLPEKSPSVVEEKKEAPIEKPPVVAMKKEIFKTELKNLMVEIASAGMGLNFVELNNYSDRNEQRINFANNNLDIGNFGTTVGGEIPNFKISKQSENKYVGVASIKGVTLEKTMEFNEENYTLKVGIKVLEGSLSKSDQVETVLSNKVLKVESSFITPAYEGTEFFAIDGGSEERERIDIESKSSQSYTQTTLSSIGSQYFAVALKDESNLIPSTVFSYKPEDQVAFARVRYPSESLSDKEGIQFTGFIGPKKYDILKKLDKEFVQMINYGIFSILSKPMLSMLKWLFSLFQNWGLAIILLTIFIRVLLLPINISSLRSMKKMQKIQPQLKAIKEKYKDDPVRVNQETMALMKKEKANPLGGCLPMLLQLPVFFALYSVLGQSVELYKAPFIFWIKDLSYQDPFFVLPIAVGALYFVQMNITPQTGMDPAQAKVMKFIPLLFCFFMITVPSGLTLYFFVNTVFGIGQQFIFQREKRKAAA